MGEKRWSTASLRKRQVAAAMNHVKNDNFRVGIDSDSLTINDDVIARRERSKASAQVEITTPAEVRLDCQDEETVGDRFD